MSSSLPSLHSTHLVVFFDLETTGLDIATSDIVELGAKIDALSSTRPGSFITCGMSNTFTSLIRLDQHAIMPECARRVHGITTEVLMESSVESFMVVWSKFVTWLDAWRKQCEVEQVVLIAHNSFSFDLLLIRARCGRNAISLPRWIQFGDSLIAITSAMSSYRGSKALLRLAEQLHVSRDGCLSHRALGDVELLDRVVKKLPNVDRFYYEIMRSLRPKIWGPVLVAATVPPACPTPSIVVVPPMSIDISVCGSSSLASQ